MGDDYHFIISLIEMERCLTEALILRLLVNLVNTLAICAVNRKTETGKGQFRIRLTRTQERLLSYPCYAKREIGIR